MKKLILFSIPTENNKTKLIEELFPNFLDPKVFAYLPSNGSLVNQSYVEPWIKEAKCHNTQFLFIDNTKIGQEAQDEIKKLCKANILFITGGNTFELLNNLRTSGLDEAIVDFSKREDTILAAFSAGAIVLGPHIDIVNQPAGKDKTSPIDENIIGITDLTGLNIINFEIFPHYDENFDKETVIKYSQNSKYEVKAISDEEILIIQQQV